MSAVTLSTSGSMVSLSFIFFAMPGTISISSPTLSMPCMSEPPTTPPLSFDMSAPGLFTSNERATYMRAGSVVSRLGVGMVFSIASMSLSMFAL